MRLGISKRQWAIGGLTALVLAACVAGWYGVTYPLRAVVRAYDEGRWAMAVQRGTSYLETHPRSDQVRLIVARAYLQLGRWEDAERAFATIEKLDRIDIEARAVVLGRLNRLQEAADLYQGLCEENPDDPQCIQQWAASLISLGKLDQAIEISERLGEFPSHARTSDYLLAAAYYQKLEYANAVKYFERLYESDPDLSDPITQRRVFWEDFGTALLRLGRLDEAQRLLERAAVLYGSPEILDLLAQVHDSRRDVQRAEQYWLQAIALHPSYLPALKALARIALQQDDPKKSVEYLNRALEFAPNDIAIHTNLAAAYGRAGYNDEAAVHANWASQLRQLQNLREQLAAQARGNPDAPEMRLLSAIRDIEARRLTDAEIGLRSILQENPNFLPAQQLLQALSALQ